MLTQGKHTLFSSRFYKNVIQSITIYGKRAQRRH